VSDWLDAVKWDAQGLVPAIAQDAASGEILMVAWMNREALEETARTMRGVYFSRSATNCGARARNPVMCRTSAKSGWTATTTWCC
jgi:phosphoribosyl-AMP cyclohydrolase